MKRYQAHRNIVFEMIEKAQLYPESRLKEALEKPYRESPDSEQDTKGNNKLLNLN